MLVTVKVQCGNKATHKWLRKLGIPTKYPVTYQYQLMVPHGLTITNLRMLKKKIDWLTEAGATVPLYEIKRHLACVKRAIGEIK